MTEAVLAADTTGNVFSSFPLAEDGNYTFWVFSDPYKATVTKENGTEEEQDIYEAYNFGLVRGVGSPGGGAMAVAAVTTRRWGAGRWSADTAQRGDDNNDAAGHCFATSAAPL